MGTLTVGKVTIGGVVLEKISPKALRKIGQGFVTTLSVLPEQFVKIFLWEMKTQRKRI